MSKQITAQDVQKLREVSGVGMMDCKKALVEAEGDFDKAIEILRKKGAKTAEKRSDREVNEGFIASYIHNGRVGVMVELNSETDFVAKNDDFKALAQDIALHIAGINPTYISPEEISAEVIEKEKEIEKVKLEKEGKPAEMIEKILEGKVEKYYNEVCLLKQPFIKDDKKTVGDILNEAVAKMGEKITVSRFVRFEIGKGTIIAGK